jgi:hypothetical protein
MAVRIVCITVSSYVCKGTKKSDTKQENPVSFYFEVKSQIIRILHTKSMLNTQIQKQNFHASLPLTPKKSPKLAWNLGDIFIERRNTATSVSHN